MRSTLSSSWNRVARLTPILSPRVELQRQIFRGDPWHIVRDPISNDFFRLNPVSYHLVGLFDGKRTADEVWRLALDRFGDEAPTQDEIIGLLWQLYAANLLRIDLPPDAEPLLARKRKRRLQHWSGQAMSILFLRIPLFNPDRLLTWLLPIFRPLLSRWGLGLWLLWIAYALWQFIPHLSSFTQDANSVLAPANWPWMAALFLLTKAVHEMGHGLVCRRFGGIVPQVGIIILVLFPAPYVDATSSWNFSDKWKRLLVAAAGMIFEIAVACGAALVWIVAKENSPGSLTQQLAYNLIFIASVTTIVFNGNPLLRFDAYYMLSDLLEIPNLYDRSRQQIYWLIQRFAFGMPDVISSGSTATEQVLLTGYGILATIYRFVVLFGIFTFVIGKFYIVGVLLALWSLIAWMLLPLLKGVRWLVAAPELRGHRARALTATAVCATTSLLVIGVVPIEDHRRAHGFIDSLHSAELIAQVDGFVIDVPVKANQQIRKNDVVLVTENPMLQARRDAVRAKLDELQIEYHRASELGPNAREAARERLAYTTKLLDESQRQIDKLTIRSPQNGTIVGAQLQQLKGTHLKRGQIIAKVVALDQLRVTALVSQAHNAPLFEGQTIRKVHLRTAGLPDRELKSSPDIEVLDTARSQLPHPALGYLGGGPIATDPTDPKGQKMLRRHFEIRLVMPPLPDASGRNLNALPGQRVHVRFTLARDRPLLSQWFRQLRQVIRNRITV